jgi:hypothetical protein
MEMFDDYPLRSDVYRSDVDYGALYTVTLRRWLKRMSAIKSDKLSDGNGLNFFSDQEPEAQR